MEFSLAAVLPQIFTGLVLGMIFVLLAIGLSLIFGLMTVVNFAHGALYMLGAYCTVFLLGFTRNFWVALVVAPLMVGTFGLLVERFLIRRLYGRGPDDPLLLTFGLSLVLIETAKLIWGKIGLTLDPPRELGGAVNLGFMAFPAYRLFVSAVTVVVLLALWAFLTRTNVGLIIRAGSRDPLMVRALGIDLNRIWLLVFGIGCALAGLAGALAGPMRGAYAEMGVTMVIESFVVVVVGGMGSLLGAVVAGIMMGQVVGITTFFAPKLAEIMVFVVMALVLLVRPSARLAGADLRPLRAGLQSPLRLHGAPVLRPRRLLRPRGLRDGHRARQAQAGLALAGARRGAALGRPGRRGHRLLLSEAPRHLLRHAHAGLCPAPVLHRLPPGRHHGRRRRTARHSAAAREPLRLEDQHREPAGLLLLRLRAGVPRGRRAQADPRLAFRHRAPGDP